nr:hypothetical protein [Pseudomonas laurylsulfatiphila]
MKRYYMEMGAAAALYSVLLILSVILLKDQQDMAMALKIVITLLPVIPAGLMCWATCARWTKCTCVSSTKRSVLPLPLRRC